MQLWGESSCLTCLVKFFLLYQLLVLSIIEGCQAHTKALWTTLYLTCCVTQELINAITEQVFKLMSTVLFEADWKVFALLVTIQRLSSAQAFSHEELHVFVNDVKHLQLTPNRRPKEKPQWIAHEVRLFSLNYFLSFSGGFAIYYCESYIMNYGTFGIRIDLLIWFVCSCCPIQNREGW